MGPDTSQGSDTGHDLPSVRAELRRLGYLDHGLERYLLQDALKPAAPWRTLLGLALRVGLAGGAALALAVTFALSTANGNLSATPFDLLPLFAHLLPVASVSLGLGFLALAGLVVAVLRLYSVRRIETLSLVAALGTGGTIAALAVWRLLPLLDGSPRWQVALLAVATAALTYGLIKLVQSGLLALAIKLTDLAPRRRLFSRRWIAGSVAVALLLVTLPAVLAVRGAPGEGPQSLPVAPGGERVLLVGLDGVLPGELDYLLARGELPALAGLLGQGGRLWRYRRPAEAPAVFWTSVATGLAGAEHGVASLDSFLPAGVTTPLAKNGPLRPYWRWLAEPLGLAEYRPLLANRRQAFTFWELASRGGKPVVAVNWWATFPAEPLPGLVVAHGAYQLLAEGAAGALASQGSPELVAAAEALQPKVEPGPAGEQLAAALGPERLAEVLEKALLPDRFALDVAEHALTAPAEPARPRATALYLPGLDIAALGWREGDVAFADLVRARLVEVDRFVARHAAALGAVAVVFDPGRRAGRGEKGREGRMLLAIRAGCRASQVPGELETMSPEAVTAGLLRAAGLPQSRELPSPPEACRWPAPPDVLPGYGPRRPAAPPASLGAEYLESLRSLGYL